MKKEEEAWGKDGVGGGWEKGEEEKERRWGEGGVERKRWKVNRRRGRGKGRGEKKYGMGVSVG
jgi:hypothetical protein